MSTISNVRSSDVKSLDLRTRRPLSAAESLIPPQAEIPSVMFKAPPWEKAFRTIRPKFRSFGQVFLVPVLSLDIRDVLFEIRDESVFVKTRHQVLHGARVLVCGSSTRPCVKFQVNDGRPRLLGKRPQNCARIKFKYFGLVMQTCDIELLAVKGSILPPA